MRLRRESRIASWFGSAKYLSRSGVWPNSGYNPFIGKQEGPKEKWYRTYRKLLKDIRKNKDNPEFHYYVRYKIGKEWVMHKGR